MGTLALAPKADLQQGGLNARHGLDALLLRERQLVDVSVRAVEDDVDLDIMQSLKLTWWRAVVCVQMLQVRPASLQGTDTSGGRRHCRGLEHMHVPLGILMRCHFVPTVRHLHSTAMSPMLPCSTAARTDPSSSTPSLCWSSAQLHSPPPPGSQLAEQVPQQEEL